MPEIRRAEPPYLQVARHIRDQIASGELQPGDPVPSSREIVTKWGVAKATAEKALQALRGQGLVEAEPGRGTKVRRDLPIYRTNRDRYAIVRRTGRIYIAGERARILAAEEVAAPADVAAALRVEAGAAVVRRHRVTDLEGQPLSSSTSWFTSAVGAAAPQLLTQARILEGTPRYVELCTGRTITYGEEQVLARLATPEEAAELGHPVPLAVLETRHTALDEHDEPLTYEVGLAKPGYQVTYNYQVERRSEEQ